MNEAHDDDDDDDVDWGEDVSEDAVNKRRMEELSGAVSSMVVTDDLDKSPRERVDIFYAFIKVITTSTLSTNLLFFSTSVCDCINNNNNIIIKIIVRSY